MECSFRIVHTVKMPSKLAIVVIFPEPKLLLINMSLD